MINTKKMATYFKKVTGFLYSRKLIFLDYKIITIIGIFLINLQSINAAGILNGDVISDMENGAGLVGEGAGIDTTADVSYILAIVIEAFLGVLGLVFVILILIAGFKWMNANGKEDDVKVAQDSIKRAVIGLAIIVAAYAITAFVFKQLDQF